MERFEPGVSMLTFEHSQWRRRAHNIMAKFFSGKSGNLIILNILSVFRCVQVPNLKQFVDPYLPDPNTHGCCGLVIMLLPLCSSPTQSCSCQFRPRCLCIWNSIQKTSIYNDKHNRRDPASNTYQKRQLYE